MCHFVKNTIVVLGCLSLLVAVGTIYTTFSKFDSLGLAGDIFSPNYTHRTSDQIDLETKPLVPLQTVYRYFELARNGQLKEGEETILDSRSVPKVTTSNESSNGQNVTLHSGKRADREDAEALEIDMKAFDEYELRTVNHEYPIMIEKLQLSIVDYSVKVLEENRCRIRVDVAKLDGKTLHSKDFYLVKNPNDHWKIYRIAFPFDLDY